MSGGALREIITLFGLDVDKGSFKAADAKVDQLRKGITNLARAFAGGFIVNELRKMVDETVALGDKTAKTAASLGISTDALQELRYAGDLSGVAVEKMDSALGRFVKGTAEAAQGTGEAKDALYELGVRLRDNRGHLRTADEMLGDVADRLAGFSSEGDRARIAAKLFGRESGAVMVNALRGGSQGLAEMRAEARALGGVLDTELIDLTEQYNDEQGRVSFAIRGVKNDIVKGLLPALIASAKATVAWVRENRELISEALLRAMKAFLIMVDAGASLVWALVRGIQAIGDAMGSSARGVAIAVVLFAALALAMGLPVAVAIALAGAIQDVATYFQGGRSVTGLIVDFIDKLTESPMDPNDVWIVTVLKAIRGALEGIGAAFSAAENSFNEFEDWAGHPTLFGETDAERSAKNLRDRQAARYKARINAAASAPLPSWVSRDYAPATASLPMSGGGAGSAGAPSSMTSSVTVNQTINAAPGQDPAAVGAAAGKSAGDVVAEQNRRAIRALVPQGAGAS